MTGEALACCSAHRADDRSVAKTKKELMEVILHTMRALEGNEGSRRAVDGREGALVCCSLFRACHCTKALQGTMHEHTGTQGGDSEWTESCEAGHTRRTLHSPSG